MRSALPRPLRAPIAIALLLSAVLLAACASVPQKTLRERQADALSGLGFTQQADGDWLLALPERISFEFDSDALRPDFRTRVAGFAQRMLAVDIRAVRVEGHSDNVGGEAYNRTLSQHRAEAVASVLVANGYAARDVECEGMGFAHPAASNDTAEGRAENRRVELIVRAGALAAP